MPPRNELYLQTPVTMLYVSSLTNCEVHLIPSPLAKGEVQEDSHLPCLIKADLKLHHNDLKLSSTLDSSVSAELPENDKGSISKIHVDLNLD